LEQPVTDAAETVPPEPPEANTGSSSSATVHFQGGGGLAEGAAVTISAGEPGTVTGSGGGSGGNITVQGSERIEEHGEDVEAVPAEPDHKGLLHELAGIIRDIPLNALEVGHVSELKSWLTSHHL
jgi:hypothetical protein